MAEKFWIALVVTAVLALADTGMHRTTFPGGSKRE
jgi:hypothetical protein